MCRSGYGRRRFGGMRHSLINFFSAVREAVDVLATTRRELEDLLRAQTRTTPGSDIMPVEKPNASL